MVMLMKQLQTRGCLRVHIPDFLSHKKHLLQWKKIWCLLKPEEKKIQTGPEASSSESCFFRSVFPLIGLNLNSAKTRRACLENQTSTQSCHALHTSARARAKARAEINGKDPGENFKCSVTSCRPFALLPLEFLNHFSLKAAYQALLSLLIFSSFSSRLTVTSSRPSDGNYLSLQSNLQRLQCALSAAAPASPFSLTQTGLFQLLLPRSSQPQKDCTSFSPHFHPLTLRSSYPGSEEQESLLLFLLRLSLSLTQRASRQQFKPV